jgi:hypothetical protein
MTNEPETNEDVTTEGAVIEDLYEGLDETFVGLIEKQGTTLEEPEGVAEGESEEGVETPEADPEATQEPEYLFELEDGTKVTAEEAQKGYLRHSDYTKKTQSVAEERKAMEKHQALLDYLSNNPDAVDMLVEKMKGGQSQTATTNGQPQANELQVPENYKGDQFVEAIVPLVNELRKELAEVRGVQESNQQTKTNEQRANELNRIRSARLAESHEWLKGQLGEAPDPKDYVNRIQNYFAEKNMAPEVYDPYLTGPNSEYLHMVVERIYRDDIAAVNRDKSAEVEKERKKRASQGTSLRTAGKTNQAPPQSLPKDPKEALQFINDQIDEARSRR